MNQKTLIENTYNVAVGEVCNLNLFTGATSKPWYNVQLYWTEKSRFLKNPELHRKYQKGIGKYATKAEAEKHLQEVLDRYTAYYQKNGTRLELDQRAEDKLAYQEKRKPRVLG